jgi:hypothetical protein
MHRFNRQHSFPGLLSESYTLRHLSHIGCRRTAKLSNADQFFKRKGGKFHFEATTQNQT